MIPETTVYFCEPNIYIILDFGYHDSINRSSGVEILISIFSN